LKERGIQATTVGLTFYFLIAGPAMAVDEASPDSWQFSLMLGCRAVVNLWGVPFEVEKEIL